MTILRSDLDATVAAWLAAERPSSPPGGLLEEVTKRVRQTRRRSGWLVLDRWTWRHAVIQVVWTARAIALAMLIALLVVAAVVAFVVGTAQRRPPPFGVARPGYIAVDTPEGIVLALPDGTNRHVLVPANGAVINPTWSRDGLSLAFWHRDETAQAWSLEVVRADGSGRWTLANDVTLREREAVLHQPSNLSWSPDSRQIAYAADRGQGSAIFVADLETFGPRQVVASMLRAIDPAWSPDGQWIAFQSQVGSGALHVVRPDGSDEHQLSWLTGTQLWPEWSPDGQFILTTAKFHGDFDIFTVSADGHLVRDVSHNPDHEYSPTWSNDGTRISWGRVIEQGAGGALRAYVVVADADGTNQRVLPEPAGLAPSIWSPDDTRLYNYVEGPGGQIVGLIVLDPAGEAPVLRIPVVGNLGNGTWQRLP
jgi:Tol biopolymer transport system component